MEDEYIEIFWTCATIDEARKVSRYLVQQRLVACAQIIPWIESVYMWNNRLEVSQESKVTFKTRRRCYPKIEKVILENSSYEVPEITFSTISGGLDTYLSWIDESTPDFSDVEAQGTKEG